MRKKRVEKKEEVPKSTILKGMKEICEYTRFSELIVQRNVRGDAFPAKKINHIWVADSIEVDKWFIKMLKK